MRPHRLPSHDQHVRPERRDQRESHQMHEWDGQHGGHGHPQAQARTRLEMGRVARQRERAEWQEKRIVPEDARVEPVVRRQQGHGREPDPETQRPRQPPERASRCGGHQQDVQRRNRDEIPRRGHQRLVDPGGRRAIDEAVGAEQPARRQPAVTVGRHGAGDELRLVVDERHVAWPDERNEASENHCRQCNPGGPLAGERWRIERPVTRSPHSIASGGHQADTAAQRAPTTKK